MGKNRKLYLTDYCLTPHVHIPNAGILCEESKIIGIGGASAFSLDEPGLEVIDVTDSYAIPGLIDSHVHGGGSFDTEMALKPGQDLRNLSNHLASHGVTSFLPTLTSMPRDAMLKTVARLVEMMGQPMPGAAPCGLHLEGPFINVHKCGSQAPDACAKIDLGYFQELIDAGGGKIKIVTFAPELENSEKLIGLMLDNGIIPSMGHTMADAEAALRAIDAGARRCTHLFNGLPPFHHRISSITDVVLTRNDVSVEVILDGAHLEPRVVDITARVKPNDKVIGISNSIQFVEGQNPNLYSKNGRIYTAGGIMAGTTMTLDTGWMHLRTYSHMPNNQAAACFTSNPAQDLGLITRGELSPGKRSDITFFDSMTNQVSMTISNGIVVYKAAESQ